MNSPTTKTRFMTNLLNTEWLKFRKYRAFWWMIAIIALSYPGINYLFFQGFQDTMKRGEMAAQMMKLIVGTPFSFPEVWHTVAYTSSLFIFIPALAVIMFITNEYTFKTHRQNIIDGWSREQFLGGKFIDVVLVSIIVTMLYTVVALIIGLINKNDQAGSIWEGSKYIGLFMLQVFSQLSIAFLVAFLTRKAFLALGIFIFYSMILENFFSIYAKFNLNDIGRFLPFEISDRLVPPPAFFNRFDEVRYKAALADINPHILYTILLTALIWGVCYVINKKRDL